MSKFTTSDAAGVNLGHDLKAWEKIMPIYEFEGRKPVIGEGTWIAPSAEIIGDVAIGRNCYIGFGAVIRADFGTISIGNGTAVEEGVIIHEAKEVRIGSRVIIGHMAMIHDAVIEDCALVGMQSMICDYSRICEWSIIAEKSLILKRQVVPPNEIYGGAPAKKIGNVTDTHRKYLSMGQDLYEQLCARYAQTFRKTAQS